MPAVCSVSQSLTDCLKVEPKTIETTPSRPFNSSLSDLLSRISPSASPGRRPHPSSSRAPAEAPNTLVMPNAYGLHPELTRPTPVNSANSTPDPAQPQLHYDCHQQKTQGGEVDSLFIRAVTAAELVCGERKYKCSGCLRFYDHLGALLRHIDQGWREGFSCRVFYRKLKSMQEHRARLSGGRNADRQSRGSSVHLGSAFMATTPMTTPTPTEGQQSHASKDKKADMIHKWLLKTEITVLKP